MLGSYASDLTKVNEELRKKVEKLQEEKMNLQAALDSKILEFTRVSMLLVETESRETADAILRTAAHFTEAPTIVIAKPTIDVRVLDEEAMRRCGWIRAERTQSDHVYEERV